MRRQRLSVDDFNLILSMIEIMQHYKSKMSQVGTEKIKEKTDIKGKDQRDRCEYLVFAV